jgi:hypothetical protein
VKKNLKPYAYKQSEPEQSGDGVLFVERTGELLFYARLSDKARSRSESESKKGVKYKAVDPKPGDLPMGRVKRK